MELRRILAEVLEELREPLRSTVILRYYGGKSSAEIAREQCVPEGTVRRRLKEGLDELRARLARRYRDDRWALVIAPLSPTAAAGSRLLVNGFKSSTLTKLATVAFAGAVLSVGSTAFVTRALSGSRSSPVLERVENSQRTDSTNASNRPSDESSSSTHDLQQGTIMKGNRLRMAVPALALASSSVGTSAFADKLPGRDSRYRPIAWEVIQSRQGFAGEVRQVFDWLLDEPVTVRRLHEEESRDPDWAPQMERVLRDRFFAVERTPELREVVTAIGCRQSTCEIRIEYPLALEAALESDEVALSSGRILSRVFRAAGAGAFLAPIVGSGASGMVASAAPARRWQTQYLAFSPENIDPETYGSWIAAQRRRDKAAK